MGVWNDKVATYLRYLTLDTEYCLSSTPLLPQWPSSVVGRDLSEKKTPAIQDDLYLHLKSVTGTQYAIHRATAIVGSPNNRANGALALHQPHSRSRQS